MQFSCTLIDPTADLLKIEPCKFNSFYNRNVVVNRNRSNISYYVLDGNLFVYKRIAFDKSNTKLYFYCPVLLYSL